MGKAGRTRERIREKRIRCFVSAEIRDRIREQAEKLQVSTPEWTYLAVISQVEQDEMSGEFQRWTNQPMELQ